MNTSHKGAATELRAAAILFDLGCEVFRNLSPAGPHDLCIMRKGWQRPILVDVTLGMRDVRTGTIRSGASSKLRAQTAETVFVLLGVELWYAILDTSKGILFEGKNGYPIAYEIVTIDLLERLGRR